MEEAKDEVQEAVEDGKSGGGLEEWITRQRAMKDTRRETDPGNNGEKFLWNCQA
ncbi:hypothetical protein K0M31_019885 [Melipona bicolor]|uniref:Uncharacterized protein n=1 Tax=Melipona bicolor TaxID=60889 RepID=A0AA40G0D6_9HYME|nr:hypothetical protein K0M31_019885 [Melipona bicolor]